MTCYTGEDVVIANRRLRNPQLDSYLALMEQLILAIDPPLEHLRPNELVRLGLEFGGGENIYALARRAHSEFMRNRILGVK